MIMALYLYLLVILVALACWRTVMVFSLVTVAANVTPYTNITQR
jgi:hypothetical protein